MRHLLHIHDVNEVANRLTCAINVVLDSQAPIRVANLKTNHAPWLDDNIKTHIKLRDELRKKSMNLKTPQAWEDYRKQRNLTTSLVRKAKKNKITRNLTETRSEDMWKEAKMQLGWSTPGPPTAVMEGGNLKTKQKEVADVMNLTLTEKVNKVKNKIKDSNIDPLSYTRKFLENKQVGTFKLGRVTRGQVFNVIKLLKNTNAAGHDSIPAVAIKRMASVITPYVTHLINLSLSQGVFPDVWKLGKIIPLYKGKGDLFDGKNYRPVANLCSLSKVIEKVIALRLNKYMESSGLFSDNQHAYRRHRNCTTAILQMQDCILKDCESGNDSAVVLTDLSCAFDTINHEVLLGKLKLYGFDDEALNWFRSYFSNRAQFVQIGCKRSDIIKILLGVFQGSILGPITFIIFMNDVVVISRNGELTIIYADDTSFVIKLSGNKAEDQEKLDIIMGKVSDYMDSNSLAFNFNKSELIIVSTRNQQHDLVLHLGGQVIQPTTDARVLGMRLTSDLKHNLFIVDMNQETHGQMSLLGQITTRVNAIIQLKKFSTTQKLKELAAGLVYSKLNFGIEYWGNCPSYLLHKLDIQLKRMIRGIYGLHNRDSVEKYMAELDFLYCEDLRTYQDLLTLERIITNGTPRSFGEQIVKEFGRYRTRGMEIGALRMTQDTAPVYTPRHNFFFSRACRAYNKFGVFQMEKSEGIDVWKKGLRYAIRMKQMRA